ncbi:hypothetical protein B7494_g4657 [Chlorociboria aeruginascens]|nr:hypothetical protein B7494_g4657 [Chlorociboria aeruginascens]
MLSALQNPRQAAAQVLNFALILSTAFMMWKGLSVVADSPSPIVVVLSGSMEPAFQRGDLLFLWNRNLLEETKVGEIVVYNVKGKDIPIVHRLVRKFGTGRLEKSKVTLCQASSSRQNSQTSTSGQSLWTRAKRKLTGTAQGGKFEVLVDLPNEYPFKPPKISFKTRVWHPNVTFDEHGSICVGILKAEAWKPSSKLRNVFTAVQQLLLEPVPDDALEASIGEKYKNDRDAFNKEAKDWTKKYAIGK